MSKRVGKWVSVNIDDSGGTARDISNDVTAINGLPLTYNPVEVGGYQQNMMYLIGRGDSEITLTVLANPTATTGAHTVLSGIVGGNTARTVTIAVGNNAAPTTGDPEIEGEMICSTYTVTPDLNGPTTAEVTLKVASGQTLPAWGTVA